MPRIDQMQLLAASDEVGKNKERIQDDILKGIPVAYLARKMDIPETTLRDILDHHQIRHGRKKSLPRSAPDPVRLPMPHAVAHPATNGNGSAKVQPPIQYEWPVFQTPYLVKRSVLVVLSRLCRELGVPYSELNPFLPEVLQDASDSSN